jgi:hypothetical protein
MIAMAVQLQRQHPDGFSACMTSETRNQQDFCTSIAQNDVTSFESMTKHLMIFTAVRASAWSASVK